MRNKKTLLFGAIVMLLLASCNDSKEQRSATTNSPDSNTTTTSNSESSGKPNINVTITGCDMAGNYSATCKEGCCSWGIAGENVFGNQYSETGKGPKGTL